MSGQVSDFKVAHRRRCITQVVAALVFLTACSSHSTPSSQQPAQSSTSSAFTLISDTVKGSVKGAFQAALSPLQDIGLNRPEIPKPLKAISDNPYAMPQPSTCESINTEITALDTILGPDVATTITHKVDSGSLASSWNSVKNVSWSDRNQYAQEGSSFTQKMAAETVRDRINNLIPYRSWIRWVSGADARDKKVARYFEAGKLRRAFLKGYSTSLHCYADTDVVPVKPAERPHQVEAKNDAEEVASADENDDKQ